MFYVCVFIGEYDNMNMRRKERGKERIIGKERERERKIERERKREIKEGLYT